MALCLAGSSKRARILAVWEQHRQLAAARPKLRKHRLQKMAACRLGSPRHNLEQGRSLAESPLNTDGFAYPDLDLLACLDFLALVCLSRTSLLFFIVLPKCPRLKLQLSNFWLVCIFGVDSDCSGDSDCSKWVFDAGATRIARSGFLQKLTFKVQYCNNWVLGNPIIIAIIDFWKSIFEIL